MTSTGSQHDRPNQPQRGGSAATDNAAVNAEPADCLTPLPDLIPVRMLNEFAYCPRLGYLEWVHGEWEDNFETLNGTFGHRRVDMPDTKSFAAGAPDATVATAEQGGNTLSQSSSENGSTTEGSGNAGLGNDDLGSDDSNRPVSGDTAGGKTKTKTKMKTIHSRSLMLSAPNEGLIAKLDLVEIDGMTATPVDYKRGKIPTVAEGAYEPERVQMCAQGLILRENGFDCEEGVLYFIASKKRVVIPFDDALIARTRELAIQFREVAKSSNVPAPLVDSPKCPRCSLVGICLPDEVNLLRESEVDVGDAVKVDAGKGRESFSAGSSALSGIGSSPGDLSGLKGMDEKDSRPSQQPTHLKPVRKLLPARDNALPLYMQEQGSVLGKSGDRLTMKKKGKLIGERRLIDVSQVSLFGSVMMSAQGLRELNRRGIPVCHFSYGGWFHGMTTGLVHKNVELRIQQYAIAADTQRSLQIAKQLIAGKIRNARTLLRRHLPKTEKPRLTRLEDMRRKVERTDNAESLLGLEGMAAKIYFEGLFQMMGERHDFHVKDRNRRPPKDPVNAVLSFAYALLVKELTIVLQAVGFDPMLGVLHRPRYGRPSLALDLAEEYRPLIADSVMMTAFNNGELDRRSFLERAGAVSMTQSGRAALIATFERRMSTEVTHPLFGYRLSYRRLLEVQARLLARTVLGELHKYPAFCTR